MKTSDSIFGKNSFVQIVGVLLFGVLALTTANATSIVPLSIERLTRESTQVVEAQAMESHSEWNSTHSLIYTFTTFQVKRTLKGQDSQTVVVKQLGGRVPHYEQKVAGVRGWRSGEQSVLFLRPSEDRDGAMLVTGLMQGDFRVVQAASQVGQALLSNGIAGSEAVESFEAGQQGASHFSGAHISLQQLESRVSKAVAQ